MTGIILALQKICTVYKFLVLIVVFCGRQKCFKNILSGLQRGQLKLEMQISVKVYSVLHGLNVFSWKCKLFMSNWFFNSPLWYVENDKN